MLTTYYLLLAEQRTEADAAGGRDRFLRAQLRRAEAEGAVLARGLTDADRELRSLASGHAAAAEAAAVEHKA